MTVGTLDDNGFDTLRRLPKKLAKTKRQTMVSTLMRVVQQKFGDNRFIEQRTAALFCTSMTKTIRCKPCIDDHYEFDGKDYDLSGLFGQFVSRNFGPPCLQEGDIATDLPAGDYFYAAMCTDELKVLIHSSCVHRSENYHPKHCFKSPINAARLFCYQDTARAGGYKDLLHG